MIRRFVQLFAPRKTLLQQKHTCETDAKHGLFSKKNFSASSETVLSSCLLRMAYENSLITASLVLAAKARP
jgi:hypothetical protein